MFTYYVPFCYFKLLLGLITDTIAEFMNNLTAGTTRVCESGHTLILGWSEATARVIAQVAFVRRVYQVQNESWERRLMPWKRIKPSTPIAVGNIVILCAGDKFALQKSLKNAFEVTQITTYCFSSLRLAFSCSN